MTSSDAATKADTNVEETMMERVVKGDYEKIMRMDLSSRPAGGNCCDCQRPVCRCDDCAESFTWVYSESTGRMKRPGNRYTS